jgi:hypothetical protein
VLELRFDHVVPLGFHVHLEADAARVEGVCSSSNSSDAAGAGGGVV